MPDAALSEDGNISGSTTDIGHDYAYLSLIFSENCLTAGQWFQNEILNIYTETPDTFYEILNGGNGSSNDVGFYVETESVHAYGVLDTGLSIDSIVAGDDMKQPSISGSFNALGRVKDAFQVIRAYDTVVTRNGNYAVVVHRGDMPAGNSNIGGFQFVIAGLFCLSH
jgi:hypothetical protein